MRHSSDWGARPVYCYLGASSNTFLSSLPSAHTQVTICPWVSILRYPCNHNKVNLTNYYSNPWLFRDFSLLCMITSWLDEMKIRDRFLFVGLIYYIHISYSNWSALWLCGMSDCPSRTILIFANKYFLPWKTFAKLECHFLTHPFFFSWFIKCIFFLFSSFFEHNEQPFIIGICIILVS